MTFYDKKKKNLIKNARIISKTNDTKGPNLSIASPPYAKSSLPTDDLSKGRWDKLQRVWHSSDELSGRVLWGRHDDETDTDANVLAVGTPALTRG